MELFSGLALQAQQLIEAYLGEDALPAIAFALLALTAIGYVWRTAVVGWSGARLGLRAGRFVGRKLCRVRPPDPVLESLLAAIDTPGGDWKRGASQSAPCGDLYCAGGLHACVNLHPGTSDVKEIVKLAVCTNGGVPDLTQNVLPDLSDRDIAAVAKALTRAIAKHEDEARAQKDKAKQARLHGAMTALQNQRTRLGLADVAPGDVRRNSNCAWTAPPNEGGK